MVRPKKKRTVGHEPKATYFKPRAVPLSELEEITMTIDELETLRLSNLEKMNQADAAKKMEIHQSTFQRTLMSAREKITDALVNGKAIKIEGGEYTMPGGDGTGPIGRGPGRFGRGRGLGRGLSNAGIGGVCTCASCGTEIPHVRGQPCNQQKCPKCGTMMTRG
jgi:predicted DNA-binding protein (UPF0251 family)